MKSKKDYSLVSPLIFMGGFIILLSVVIIDYFSNPSFTAEKTECWEKAEEYHSDIKKYDNVEVFISNEYVVYLLGEGIILDENMLCDFAVYDSIGFLNREQFIIKSCFETKRPEKKENGTTFYFDLEFYYFETKTVCETKQVEKIEIIKTKINNTLLEKCSFQLEDFEWESGFGSYKYGMRNLTMIFEVNGTSEIENLSLNICVGDDEECREVSITPNKDCFDVFDRLQYEITKTKKVSELDEEFLQNNAIQIDENNWKIGDYKIIKSADNG